MSRSLRLLLAGTFLVVGTAAIALSTTAGASSRTAQVQPRQAIAPSTQFVYARWNCGPAYCRLPGNHLQMYLSPGYYIDTLEGHTSPYLRCTVTANIQDVSFLVRPDASNTEDGILHVYSPTFVRFGCGTTLSAADGEGTFFVVTRASPGH